jgi:DNA-binding SARP family transcriptional activator
LALLAYLVVTGKPHSRQHLVDLFFFDGPDDPRAALRWTLSKLRKAIGADFISADRQQIGFDFDNDYWLDVTAFEENGGLDLYRGDFLEGLYVRDAPGFEDWAFYERERLRDRYQVVLEQQLAKHENQGDDLAAIEVAHQLLRMDNLREDWYRYLMRGYARIGKRDAALTQFRRCQQVLQAELGVEPAVETTELAEAIQQGRLETARTGFHRGGHRIAARFAIGDLERSLISESSMSRVYQGVDTQTGQPVAIKIVKPGIIASQPNVIKRFVQEGQVLRRLDHPNVVKMLAALEQGGQHYLILEYVEGGSLRDLLDTQGALPIDRAARITRDLADGLGEAHRLNVIHRDLKPTNVLLAEDGTPRLTDFGIALTDGGSRLTSPGIVVGTVDYLSPEACQGESLDARTDIWALGVLLFEMLTNHRPFVGDTLTAILAAILTQPTPDLTQLRPDVPSAMADLVYRMLAKDPQQRISSAHQVGAALEAVLTGQEEVQVAGLPMAAEPAVSPPKKPRSGRVPRGFPTPLVGRATEMEILRRVWQRAAEGSGQMVLVKGEPGVGKTRLLEELLAEVAGEAIILRATCHELHEPLTYTLFIDPLRQALAGERPSSLSDTQLTEICRLLPELTECFPDLPRPVPLDAAAERRRLFDAIGATLVALATRLPLVFLVDDLQWADPTSLAVLNHLSAQIVEAPVLIVGAYRPHEVDPAHPLRKTCRVWERVGMLTNLALAPLTEEAVGALLEELTTWTGDHPSFGRLIYRETKGNPLFVVETVASLQDQGRLPQNAEGWRRNFDTETVDIPSRVQTIIEARLERLDGLSRQIATAASVMRDSFAAEVVQNVSGRNELETLEGLERLLMSGLLVEEETGRFTFSHHNIRAVVYQGISQLRSKLLHRRMAEILEKRHRGQESAVAERLAYHYEQADVQDKALDY